MSQREKRVVILSHKILNPKRKRDLATFSKSLLRLKRLYNRMYMHIEIHRF